MIQNYKNWINNSYSQIKENYVEINNLDQKLGDGDHGSTILKGLDKAVANLNIISSEDTSFFMSEISTFSLDWSAFFSAKLRLNVIRNSPKNNNKYFFIY